MTILSFDVGMKNLAFCLIDKQTILDWNVIELRQQHKEDLCSCVVRTLDKLKLLSATTVLIEKQPSKNNKMRIIEALLNAYFVIRGKSNKESDIKSVIVYSAKNKLGANTLRGKANYGERKKLSIARTKTFLEKTKQDEQFVKIFQNAKKKDDYADSLLQALSYLNDDTLDDINHEVQPPSTKVIARKPTEKQEKRGYSKNNLKWLFKNNHEINDKIEKSIKKFYKSIDEAKKDLI